MAISGTHLGPYEVVNLIGAAGMGEVDQAKDSRPGRFVAIKVLEQHFPLTKIANGADIRRRGLRSV